MLKAMLIPAGVMGGLGIVFAAGLAFAAGKFRVDSDPRVELLSSLLPGANCGGCGSSGCTGYAEALVEGETTVEACRVCDPDAKEEICSILGLDAPGEGKPLVAKVKCRGDYQLARWLARYEGVQDCRAASLIGSSPKGCAEGCLGLGSCATVCAFDAITIGADHLPTVDEEKCTGCGACVGECPRNVLALMEFDIPILVRCNSHGKGRIVRENCQVACLGCRACVRVCQEQAITMDYNLAVVDYNKCVGCLDCVARCPSGCIEISLLVPQEEALLA